MRVDAAAVELALEGQEVLAVVLLERVGARGAGADAQLSRDVLPRLVLGALQMRERRFRRRTNNSPPIETLALISNGKFNLLAECAGRSNWI